MSYKETNGKEIDDDEHSINEDGYDEQSADGKRKKKARTTFTGRQIFELEKQFEVKKYLSSSERSEMARLLNVTETQVSCSDLLLLLLKGVKREGTKIIKNLKTN